MGEVGDKIELEKACIRCGNSQSLSCFPKDQRSPDGHSGACKSCECFRLKRWARSNPDRVRGFRRAQYNIDFNSLWNKQKGLCALCAEPMLPSGKGAMSVVIDHDHQCCPPRPGRAGASCGKCVRGLLHRHCNMLVGLVEKNRDKLSRVSAYLGKGLPHD